MRPKTKIPQKKKITSQYHWGKRKKERRKERRKKERKKGIKKENRCRNPQQNTIELNPAIH